MSTIATVTSRQPCTLPAREVSVMGSDIVQTEPSNPVLSQVKILISYKADVTLKDHEGCTPLHLACGSSQDAAMELQTSIVVENLTSHGAGVNAKVGNILVINIRL